MTRNEKVFEIIKSCPEKKTVDQIAKETCITTSTIRAYANVLAEMGLIEKMLISNSGRGVYAYKSKGKKLTNNLLADISVKICAYYKEQKIITHINYLANKEESRFKKEKQCKNEIEALNNQKLGIYLLSSKPSKHFIKQFEAQNQQAMKERKSPKNYAGTSAGLDW